MGVFSSLATSAFTQKPGSFYMENNCVHGKPRNAGREIGFGKLESFHKD